MGRGRSTNLKAEVWGGVSQRGKDQPDVPVAFTPRPALDRFAIHPTVGRASRGPSNGFPGAFAGLLRRRVGPRLAAGPRTRRRRPCRTPLRRESQHTPRGHTSCVPWGGWRGAVPPLTPGDRRRRGGAKNTLRTVPGGGVPEGCRAPLPGGGEPVRRPAGRRGVRHRRARTGRGGRGRQPCRPGSGRATGDRPCRAAPLWGADALRGSGGAPRPEVFVTRKHIWLHRNPAIAGPLRETASAAVPHAVIAPQRESGSCVYAPPPER